MPGVFQFPIGEIVDEARQAQDAGLQAILLFGIPEKKDEQASGAYAENGVMQKALRVDAIEFAGLHKTADDHRAAGYLATALSHTVRVP